MPRLISSRYNVTSVASWDVSDGPSDAMCELTGIVGLTPVPVTAVNDDWWLDVLSGLGFRNFSPFTRAKPLQVFDLAWKYGMRIVGFDGSTATVLNRKQITQRMRRSDGMITNTGELKWGELSVDGHGRVVVVAIAMPDCTKVFLYSSRKEEVPWIMTVVEAYGIHRDPLTNRTRKSLAIMEQRYPASEAFVPASVLTATIIGRPRYR